MKNRLLPFTSCMVLLMTTFSLLAQKLDGAWKKTDAGSVMETTCIIADNYFMPTEYNQANKQFGSTMGGVLQVPNNETINVTIEFNTRDNNEVGKNYTVNYQLDNNKLTIDINGESSTWQRIDDGKGMLAGNWRITERENDGKMQPMKPGPRKTLKILSGSHFQWAAINTETKEFFGTGGGTYTFTNGKYTETLDFFSRDGSRVGMSLSFDGKVDGKRWHHSGKSSKGDPVSEVWTRQSS